MKLFMFSCCHLFNVLQKYLVLYLLKVTMSELLELIMTGSVLFVSIQLTSNYNYIVVKQKLDSLLFLHCTSYHPVTCDFRPISYDSGP